MIIRSGGPNEGGKGPAGLTRPTMRFVPVKSADRQAALLDHKARDFLVRQRTQIVNAIRAHLGEFGIVVAKGIHNVDRLLDAARDVPPTARPALDMLGPASCATGRPVSKR